MTKENSLSIDDMRRERHSFEATYMEFVGNRKYHNMPCNIPLVQNKFKLPKTLIREYKIEGMSENGDTFEIYVNDNHQRFVKHSVDWCVKTVRFIPIATFGNEQFRLFDFEIN